MAKDKKIKKDNNPMIVLLSGILRGILRLYVYVAYRPKVIYENKETKKYIIRNPVIFIPNHVSAQDGPVCYFLFPNSALMVAKDWYEKKWIRFATYSRPAIPLDRHNLDTAWLRDAVAMIKSGKNVFIFPNNKNIILAANQAAELTTDKSLLVIPTKTIPQGITAVINYVSELSVEDNEATMLEEIKNVKTGQVTYAVRDTMIDDKVIKQDDYMGIGDAGILSVGRDMKQVTVDMVSAMMDDSSELISIYYGSDVSEEEAQKLSDELEAAYPDCDIELQFGGQPVYYYVVSAE